MPLFWIYCVFLFMIQTGIVLIYYCCMDGVGWKRHEVGLKRDCRLSVVGFKVEVSRGITQCPQRDSNLGPAHQRL